MNFLLMPYFLTDGRQKKSYSKISIDGRHEKSYSKISIYSANVVIRQRGGPKSKDAASKVVKTASGGCGLILVV